MKITIDTAQDSKEHIRKTVEFLTSMLGEEVPMTASSNFMQNTFRSHNDMMAPAQPQMMQQPMQQQMQPSSMQPMQQSQMQPLQQQEAPQRSMSLNPLDFPDVQKANEPQGNVMGMFDSPAAPAEKPEGTVFDIFQQPEVKEEPKPEPVRIIKY